MHKLRFEAKEKISPEVGAVLISYTITPMPGALAMYVAVVVLLTVEGGDVPCREWFSGFLHTVCKTAKFFHLFLDEAIDSPGILYICLAVRQCTGHSFRWGEFGQGKTVGCKDDGAAADDLKD